jgi:ATP-binding cassette subfamily A (ABC1) protein 5
MTIFNEDTKGPLFTGGTFSRYSDLTSMGIMFADAALFLILAWYFDNVVASNRGRADSFLFPIYDLINLIRKPTPKQKQNIMIKLKALGQGEE